MIPTGLAKIPFRGYRVGSGPVIEHLLCEVEITMACFTNDTCRVRGVIREAGWDRALGETFGNHNIDLTEELHALITNRGGQDAKTKD